MTPARSGLSAPTAQFPAKGLAHLSAQFPENGADLVGFHPIAGVDEVGRGPLAGPVMAAAVMMAPEAMAELLALGLDDSKRLTPGQREKLANRIRQIATAVGLGEASCSEIDGLNIRRAALLAMERAVANLSMPPAFLLVDGRDVPAALHCPARAIIRGDGSSGLIAAASVVAKVARDQEMQRLSQRYPGYGWERNQGYPTAEHRQALRTLGATPEHRRSFGPVRLLL